MVTRVAVQQRQRLFREGLGQLLQAQDDVELVGLAVTSADLVGVCEQQCPDVVLLEADAVECDARLIQLLRRAAPALRVIGLSATELSLADASRARRCGIRDVVPRSAGIGQILSTMRSTSPVRRLGSSATSDYGTLAGDDPQSVLTIRELTILKLVGAGYTSREVAFELHISHKTVENHKQRVFTKRGVQNQAHAVSVAMRRGLMRPERVIGLAQAD